MKIQIDTDRKVLRVEQADRPAAEHDLYSPEAFEVVSRLWIKTGWARKYTYDFRWLDRPVIQLPQDLVRIQEIVWATRPEVIVETGVAHGGSAVFFASLLQLLGGEGRVVAVDVEIRPHNRKALDEHPLRHRITLVEGSSVEPATLEQVRAGVGDARRVMVMLDSNHSREHVARELELYGPLVSPGCYLLVADGVMSILDDVPGGQPHWREEHPEAAARDYLAGHPEFELDAAYARSGTTYFPGGFLRRHA